jgi:hypothetical protein
MLILTVLGDFRKVVSRKNVSPFDAMGMFYMSLESCRFVVYAICKRNPQK